jgi:glycogen(starch) synthase
MKLLVITAFYPPYHIGGYEMRCKDVVDGLSESHTIEIITTKSSDGQCRPDTNGRNVFRVLHQRLTEGFLLRQFFNDVKDIKKIDRKIKEFQPDIVYVWAIQNLSNALFPYLVNFHPNIVYDEGGGGLIYLYKIYKRGMYFYVNEKDNFLRKFLKELIYVLARILSGNLIFPAVNFLGNTHVYFNSVPALTYTRSHISEIGSSAEVITPGIKLSRFPLRPREILSHPINILVTGRIKPEKGTLDSVLLLQHLRDEGVDAHLKIVGKIQSDIYLQEIFSIAQKEGLHVAHIPMVSQNKLAQLYRQADICFFPSYFKTGLSRVPLEAMASGAMVFSYGNEGSASVITHGETGWIVAPQDFFMISLYIKEMYRNPTRYSSLVRTARKTVEEKYALPAYINKIEGYLQNSLA